MSKIPQGEWNAIAARYAKGEPISRIAQSYGCTPPAIHYILKRARQRLENITERPVDEARTNPNRAGISPFVRDRAPVKNGEPTSAVPLMHVPPVQNQTHPAIAPQRPPNKPYDALQAARSSAGLNSELHDRAEAAIEAFRISFDAALAERSPAVDARLREAAADLMRVAARTTIVLDKLSALTERSAAAPQNYLKSGQFRREFE